MPTSQHSNNVNRKMTQSKLTKYSDCNKTLTLISDTNITSTFNYTLIANQTPIKSTCPMT